MKKMKKLSKPTTNRFLFKKKSILYEQTDFTWISPVRINSHNVPIKIEIV